jgi:soluble lytic murein transglycosylase-like protein
MTRALVPAVVALLLAAVPARAELVVFQTGRVLSVKDHRVDGPDLVLTLRSGGEMICAASLVASIRPDEVPYPEPAVAPAAPDDEGGEIAPSASPLRVDARYDPLIQKVAREQGVDVGLVRAVIQVESAYQARARSAKGAVGLMQLLPSTARQYGVRNPYDPAANIEAGIKHLKSLLARFPLKLALAAYNAGEAAVERFGGVPPYPETQSYVARILALVGG